MLVAWVPISNAPENSNTVAVNIACRSINAPEPTDVPMAFEINCHFVIGDSLVGLGGDEENVHK